MTSMTVNGEAIRYRLDPDTPLLWALRDASNLTGHQIWLRQRDCGACTVIVDGRATLSCSVSIAALEGAEVTTIEGLSANRSHPLQQAWAAEQVTQCGRCDPGFIMALAALIATNPAPGPGRARPASQSLPLRRRTAHLEGGPAGRGSGPPGRADQRRIRLP